MPYIKVHIHFVWSTKSRFPFLKRPEIRQQLWQHIHENGKKKGLYIDTVNGYHDHCHCLLSLGSEQSISLIARMIKGESSFWLNQNHKESLGHQKFEWQDDYFCVSVSESSLPHVRKYICNQESHHERVSFHQEYLEFLKFFGFEKLADKLR